MPSQMAACLWLPLLGVWAHRSPHLGCPQEGADLFVSLPWSDPDSDPLADIRTLVRNARPLWAGEEETDA